MSTSAPQMHTDHELDVAVRRRFVQLGILIVIQAVALFLAAGRLDWLAGWAYMAVYVGFIGVNALILMPHGKELIAERSAVREDVKGWDKLVLILSAILGPGMLIVAGLDMRFGWSAPVASEVRVAALVVMILGYGLFSWAMASNAFFSAAVRLQKDRGHQVATGGPYRFARHPGYSGMMAFTPATALMLGSLWALIPAALLCVTMVIRTALEDRTLRHELDGYEEYAQRVRYRLLPGLW
jgi:protein-S-isoprenylcysteine O-methyltransferase Ste14